MNKRWIFRSAGCAGLIAIVCWWATGPEAVEAPPGGIETAERTLPAQGVGPSAAPEGAAPAAPDALLTSALISIFDQVLFEAQAPDKAPLMAKAPALLAKYLREDWRVRALGLLERYVDMLEALQATPPPQPGDPAYLRRTLRAQDALRRQYFRPEEIEGLFGEQMRQDNFMVDKMEALANPALTPEQRAAAISQSEQAWLSPEQREARKEAVVHVGVMAQTEALDARGASPQERFAVRSEAYGHEVARGLAALDQEHQEWNTRLDRYAGASEAEQAQLRDTLFSDAERLRLSGALAMRAAGQRKPADDDS